MSIKPVTHSENTVVSSADAVINHNLSGLITATRQIATQALPAAAPATARDEAPRLQFACEALLRNRVIVAEAVRLDPSGPR